MGTTSNALQKKDSLKPEARAAWARTERDSGSTSPSDPCSLRTEKEAIDTQIGDKQAGRQLTCLFIGVKEEPRASHGLHRSVTELLLSSTPESLLYVTHS